MRGGWDRPLHLQAQEALDAATPGIFWAAHQADLDYAQIERLMNLDRLPADGFTVACFPLRLIGGSAALAARFADEYNTTFPTLEQVRERRYRIDAACERAGRDPIPFSIMTGVVVGADLADLRERVGRLSRLRADDPDDFLASPPSGWIVDTVEQAAEQLSAMRDAGVSRVMCQQLLHEDLEAVALLGRELAPRVA